MSDEVETQLRRIQSNILETLDPFLLDEKAKRQLRIFALQCWRQGFVIGRQEGRLDQHMLGGEN